MHVPEGWNTGHVKDLLAGLNSGVSVNSEDIQANKAEIGVLKVSSVSYGVFLPKENKRVIQSEVNLVRESPRKGCIVISRSNTESLVGASVFINKDYPNLYLPDKLWQTVPRSGKITDQKWLFYFLSSEPIRYRLSKLATGTSGSMKNITKDELLTLPIKIPPYLEQQKIAQILTTWDKAIEKLEALIAAKQKRKKALMQQLLTGKKRFVGFEGEWKEVKLKKWIVEHNEKSTTQDEYRVLTSSRNGLVLQTDYFGVSRITDRENVGFNVIPNGYITYRSRSDNGLFTFNINETGESGIISTYYPVFNFPNGDNKFFIELFAFKEQIFGVYSVGTSQKVLSLNALKNIKMRIPLKEEQQKIASVLTVADTEIETHQKQLSTLKQQKKGLMQQLLTGKKRVKVHDHV